MIIMRALLATLLVLAAATAHADSSVPGNGAGSPVLASLQRTACLGRCPMYAVTVLRDGSVHWEGKRFVKVVGKAVAKLTPATIAKLVDAFKRADYFALQDRYVRYDVTDHPSALTSFDDGTRKKTIAHYHGDRSAPQSLDVLEEEIDEIVGTGRWIGPDQR
jgi:hypothetical protein